MPTTAEIQSDIAADVLALKQIADNATTHWNAEMALRVATEKALADYKAAHPDGGPVVVPPETPTVPGMPAVNRNGTRTPTPPRLSAQAQSLAAQSVASGQTKDFGGALLAGLNVGPGATARNFRFKGEGSLKVEDDGTIEDYEVLDGSKYGVEFAGRFTSRRGIIGDVSQHSLIGGDCIWMKIEDLVVGSTEFQSSLRVARADGCWLRIQVRATKTKSTARGGSLTAKGIWVIDSDFEGVGTYGLGDPLGQRDGGDGRGIKEFNIKGGGVKYTEGSLWQGAYDAVKTLAVARDQQVALAAAKLGIGNVDIAKTLAVRDSLLTEFGNVYHVNTRIKVPLIAIEAGGMMDFDVRPDSPVQFSRAIYPEWKLNGDPMRRKPIYRVAGKDVTP